jgi:hypothetical protein
VPHTDTPRPGNGSPEQVAEWAGNSVEIPLRVYAKCLAGHDEIAMRRISDVLGQPGTSARIRHDQPLPARDDRTQPGTSD